MKFNFLRKPQVNKQPVNFFALLVCVLISATFCATSHAASDKKQAERELASLKQAIIQTQAQINKTQKQQTSAEKKLKQVSTKLSQASKQLQATKQNIHKNNQQIKSLTKEKSEKKTLITKQQQRLAVQIKGAYIAGNQEYLKLLLNQQDPVKITRVLQYYKYLNQARIKDINALQANVQRLLTIEIELQSSSDALKTLAVMQTSQQQAQQKLVNEQKQAIAAIAKDYKSQTQQLAKQQADEKALQQLIRSIEKSLRNFSPEQSLQGLAKLKKKLQWPAKGKLLHKFGSSKVGSRMKWNGIMIGANSGQEVLSIHSGRVVFSDWLRGFGLLTIIDHGKGYLSLYGHNQTLFKSEGDWIEAGEPIASVGQSGGFDRPSLYFEIRYKGKPQNPVRWIK